MPQERTKIVTLHSLCYDKENIYRHTLIHRTCWAAEPGSDMLHECSTASPKQLHAPRAFHDRVPSLPENRPQDTWSCATFPEAHARDVAQEETQLCHTLGSVPWLQAGTYRSFSIKMGGMEWFLFLLYCFLFFFSSFLYSLSLSQCIYLFQLCNLLTVFQAYFLIKLRLYIVKPSKKDVTQV